MNLKKYDGESDLQFGIRCCEAKTATETWEMVGEYINSVCGTDYTSSKWRKAYQYYELVKNELKDLSLDEQKDELEKIKDEIRKERMKLQTVNIERNRIDRADARHELWFEQLADCIKKLEPPVLEDIPVKKNNKKYIATLSDIHYGSTFASANNEYSPKIVRDRFEILKAELISFIKEKQLDELTIVELGDVIQGCLRLNDLRINDATIVKACVEVAQLISAFLNDLSAYCNIVFYSVIYGNHSQQRYLGSQANAMADEDLGYVVAHYIKDVLSNNDRIRVVLPKEGEQYVEIDNIFDWNIICAHGHQLKGIGNAIKDLTMQRHKFYQSLIIGHFHSATQSCSGENYSTDCEVLVAPSICGSDNYSDSIFKGSKAASAIYGYDKEYGHTETYKIVLN